MTSSVNLGRRGGASALEPRPREQSKKQKRRRAEIESKLAEQRKSKNRLPKRVHAKQVEGALGSDRLMKFQHETETALESVVANMLMPDGYHELTGSVDHLLGAVRGLGVQEDEKLMIAEYRKNTCDKAYEVLNDLRKRRSQKSLSLSPPVNMKFLREIDESTASQKHLDLIASVTAFSSSNRFAEAKEILSCVNYLGNTVNIELHKVYLRSLLKNGRFDDLRSHFNEMIS